MSTDNGDDWDDNKAPTTDRKPNPNVIKKSIQDYLA